MGYTHKEAKILIDFHRQYGREETTKSNAMTTHILNSAVMPVEGCYNLKQISENEFAYAVFKAYHEQPESVKSWIGYEQNLNVIEDIAHVRLELCRDVTQIEHGDRLLIMRLKYRPDTASKGKKVDAEDFEFFQGYYAEQLPVPGYVDILNMDIYEPQAQSYVAEVMHLAGAHNLLRALKHTREQMRQVQDGEDEKWRQLNESFESILWMHFDPEGYHEATMREEDEEDDEMAEWQQHTDYDIVGNYMRSMYPGAYEEEE